MKIVAWFAIVICLAALCAGLWRLLQRETARRRESELRSAELVAEAMRAKARNPGPDGPG